MVGYQIVVDEPASKIADELTVQQTSQFVDKMEELQNNEPVQTQDGTHLRETIKIFAKGMNTDDEFTQEILEILDDSLAKIE